MNSKDRAIQQAIERLREDIDKAQASLYEALENQIAQLDTQDGEIQNTEGNIDLVNSLDDAFDSADGEMVALAAGIVAAIQELKKLSVEYFSDMGLEADLDEIDFIDKGLGFSEAGLVSDGYLASLVRMQDVRDEVRYVFFAAVMAGSKVSDLLDNTRNYVMGSEKGGAIQHYLRGHNLEDLFKQALCYSDKYFADKHSLQKFVYTGGLVERSRDFCIERDGLEFWRYQAEAWNDLDWAGKIEGVDFFVQVGGWNCRHYLEWLRN